ncbi:CDP-glycerol glycerophosphotransferase family protein [Natrarchaeobaculum aegyptiacum]|uniref:Uncharacterized protein n=1 Tax=Natrarchaeobaculum aegyptiacum TaxID=745377 RepID=A0A2Z2HYG8_9EURY|nr:CDP-glycerol glycerophosphotransferase family protein [Natrarchaeobaculum aegyptiacum]ARS90817.1 hypothetical protein B1756_14530 [Natrarchaeobaculum aegyptiacum]
MFDSDTLSVVVQSVKRSDIDTVFLLVSSESKFISSNKYALESITGSDTEVKIIEEGSSHLPSAVAQSQFIFIRNGPELAGYRFVNTNSERKFVRIFHGFAKASGGFRERNAESGAVSTVRLPRRFRPIDIYPVASDVELFYRSAAEGIHPAQVKKCSYPKYTRLKRLRTGKDSPILPEKTKESLGNDGCKSRILYAPTHKGTYEPTELFPFSDFDLQVLREQLESLDVVLYIRMHIHEEQAGIYDEYIDGDIIKYAGHGFSPSAAEILPEFDVLITDYSSIYTEYLALDRPILFIIDDTNPYWTNKGLAFDDEKYTPGPKISDFEDFLLELENHITDQSRYCREREFAINSLVPDRDIDFLDCILDNCIEGKPNRSRDIVQ